MTRTGGRADTYGSKSGRWPGWAAQHPSSPPPTASCHNLKKFQKLLQIKDLERLVEEDICLLLGLTEHLHVIVVILR